MVGSTNIPSPSLPSPAGSEADISWGVLVIQMRCSLIHLPRATKKMLGRPWKLRKKTMKNIGKLRKNMKTIGQLRRKHMKIMGQLRNTWKTWDNLGKPWKSWGKLGKPGSIWKLPWGSKKKIWTVSVLSKGLISTRWFSSGKWGLSNQQRIWRNITLTL